MKENETALDRVKTQYYKSGHDAGVCVGELKSIIRAKKGVKKYIKQHKELKPYEEDLLNIIIGVKL